MITVEDQPGFGPLYPNILGLCYFIWIIQLEIHLETHQWLEM